MGRSARAASLAFLLGAAGLLLGVTAAEAHSNQSVVRLAVSTDRGVTTIRAFLVYRNDQQPVIDEFVLGEVTGDTGSRSFQLQPVQRRPGYFASPVHLAPGHWTLTVTAKAATVGSASGTLTIDPAGHLSQTVLSGSFDPAALPVAGGAASRFDGRVGAVAGGVLFLLLLLIVAVKSRSSRADPDGSSAARIERRTPAAP